MNQELSKETQEKITQLQMMEQALQNSVLQKQQLSTQLIEIDSAIKELETTPKSYKIIGNIMIDTNKIELTKDLIKKKESTELRISTIEKQEQRFQEKAKSMQEELMKEIKGD
ncbi:prefoldin subunit beta [Candidatus Woesearchaeota archaeon]|nr:prefoldin subunit beta [Candidatus Woesearchaeota archaeon]